MVNDHAVDAVRTPMRNRYGEIDIGIFDPADLWG